MRVINKLLENELQLIEISRLMNKREVKMMKGKIRSVANARKELNDFMTKIQTKYQEKLNKVV